MQFVIDIKRANIYKEKISLSRMKVYGSLEKALKKLSLEESQVKTDSEWKYLTSTVINGTDSNNLFERAANQIPKEDLIGVDFLVRENSTVKDEMFYPKKIKSKDGAYFGKGSKINEGAFTKTSCYVDFVGYAFKK